VKTSRATFPISDADELPHILAEDLAAQLLPLLHQMIKDSPQVANERIFLDEAEGIITVGGTGKVR
jgi:hypothetical protein